MSQPVAATGGNDRPVRWPWAVFAVASVWSALIRIPLVLNAAGHLDSDLAVDGLTLLDATRGQWRWHYPGTPYIGTAPVLLSLPQALVWGANPVTLVSGGVVASVAMMLATFLLAWRAFGPRVAAWSLVPLTFASTGAVWLSGRITGGHLTAAAWHAGAFALMAACLDRDRGRNAVAAVGLWCGIGYALDPMLAVTLAGLIPAAVGFWVARGKPARGLRAGALFGVAFLAGVWPRYVGARVDPYDAYREQFSIVTDRDLLASHGRLLAAECLPRLIAGHRLPGLEADPEPSSIASPGGRRRRQGVDVFSVGVVGLSLSLAAASTLAFSTALFAGPAPSRAVAWGLTASTMATLAGFVANRNIFDSDNYRYLVALLVPGSLGYGLLMDRLSGKGRPGVIAAGVCSVLLAVVMTADLARWYARFGWIDDRGLPARERSADPALAWLDEHPGVSWIEGGYWDVYRLAFLTGGRVRGVPFPVYPNRFPEWRRTPGAGLAMVLRPTPEGMAFRDAALSSGLRPVFRGRGVLILAPP